MAIDMCCGCFSLETGGFIIGGLGIIYSIIEAIVLTSGFLQYPDGQEIDSFTKVVFIVSIVLHTINIIISICLVIGVQKRNHRYLVPYLVQCSIQVMLLGVMTFLCLIALMNTGGGLQMIALVSFLFSFILGIYILRCMFALYERFKEESLSKQGNAEYGQVSMK